jgi:hypothetical protein
MTRRSCERRRNGVIVWAGVCHVESPGVLARLAHGLRTGCLVAVGLVVDPTHAESE